MRAIGGYPGLELAQREAFHKDAVALNSGRNALEYILLGGGYHKIYLPWYTCPAVIQPIQRLSIDLEFYSIDEQLEPVFDFERLDDSEAFVYTNYFGLKGEYVRQLAATVKNLIVDNAQAFYDLPVGNCFYSPRKFFGVADGGYAYSDQPMSLDLEVGQSAARSAHLLIREDEDAESGYAAFRAAEESLEHQPMRKMSRLTGQILSSIDYEVVATKRRNNFLYLHQALKDLNRLRINLDKDSVPMAYPFLAAAAGLRNKLISKRIFIPSYWPDLNVPEGSFESLLTRNLVPLPIDQRLDRSDLDYILHQLTSEYPR